MLCIVLSIVQKIPGDDFTDINATRSQDAVIIETNEQDVEEASTADIRKRDDSAAEVAPDVALVPTREEHVIGRIGASDGGGGVPFERYSSLGQRDGCESREASNGTGLFSDEKEEAGKISLNSHIRPDSSSPFLLKILSSSVPANVTTDTNPLFSLMHLQA